MEEKYLTARVGKKGEFIVNMKGSWSGSDLRRLWTAITKAASKLHLERRKRLNHNLKEVDTNGGKNIHRTD